MKHYTYRVRYADGKSYVGVRSCHTDVYDDAAYIGSSKHTPDELFVSKEILGIFPTREDAVAHEIELHALWNVAQSDKFYNRSRQTSSKFDTTGVSFDRSAEHNEKIRAALTGRQRSPQECAAISKAKKGKPHAPHSEETKRKLSEKRKGIPNHMKGQKYDAQDHLRHYQSRTKYAERYSWINDQTGQTEIATCMEMGLKYGAGAKPTQRFRDVVKPDCKSKSYKGWRLQNGN